jgi:hypothetical protein
MPAASLTRPIVFGFRNFASGLRHADLRRVTVGIAGRTVGAHHRRDHERVEKNQSCGNSKYQALHKFLLFFWEVRGDTGMAWLAEKQTYMSAQVSGIRNK